MLIKNFAFFIAPQIDSKPAKAVLKHTNLKKETNNGHVPKFQYIQHTTQFNRSTYKLKDES